MDIWGLKGLRLGNNFFNCLFLLLYNDSQICCLEVTEVMGVSLHHITGEKSHKPSPIIVKRSRLCIGRQHQRKATGSMA